VDKVLNISKAFLGVKVIRFNITSWGNTLNSFAAPYFPNPIGGTAATWAVMMEKNYRILRMEYKSNILVPSLRNLTLQVNAVSTALSLVLPAGASVVTVDTPQISGNLRDFISLAHTTLIASAAATDAKVNVFYI
jgi:hypothetical protein